MATLAASGGAAIHAAPANKHAAPTGKHAAPAGDTTISITRSGDMLYVVKSAAVEVNGQKVASLDRGETYTAIVAPGSIELRVSNWSSPGASSYSFIALPGKTYRFTVSPRSGNFVATLAGGLVGSAIEGHGAFDIVPAP